VIQKKTPDPTKAESSAANTAQSIATSKEFNALRSAFAQQGHYLHSLIAPGGKTTFWAERWGLVRYLPSLHDAALFLAQIGGRL
jgi:hypothetical protein